jgi:hypothetical protein
MFSVLLLEMALFAVCDFLSLFLVSLTHYAGNTTGVVCPRTGVRRLRPYGILARYKTSVALRWKRGYGMVWNTTESCTYGCIFLSKIQPKASKINAGKALKYNRMLYATGTDVRTMHQKAYNLFHLLMKTFKLLWLLTLITSLCVTFCVLHYFWVVCFAFNPSSLYTQ